MCARDVDTARAEETVVEVARRMRDRQVGSLVVVDDQNRPMGLVSDRDLTVRALAHGAEAVGARVETVMTAMPTVVLEGTSVESALGTMRTGGHRRLPVVDGAGRLVGLLTLDDVLRCLADEFALIGGLIEREAPHREPIG